MKRVKPHTDRAGVKAAMVATKAATLRASHARIVQMFRMYGDLTDAQLQTYLHDMEKAAGFVKLMSPSGVRSRRNELSKPNETRLAELRAQWFAEHKIGILDGTDVQYDAADEWARRTLRLEGFKSPLWDTGKKVIQPSGHGLTIWGLAV